MKKRLSSFCFVALMSASLLSITAYAANTDATTFSVPDGYRYIGYTCGSKDCGGFWAKDQKYLQYANSNGDVYTEYAGFGVCC